MIRNVLAYSAANSVLGALRQKGYTPDIVNALIRTPDLASCLEELPRQIPQFALSGSAGTHPVTSGQPLASPVVAPPVLLPVVGAESSLHQHYKNCCRMLLKFLPVQAAHLLRVFLSSYDFAVLKRYFRKAVFPDFSAEMTAEPSPGTFLTREESDPGKEVFAADDLPAMVRGTPLAKPVAKALSQYERKPFLYYFEIVLDAGYLALLAEAAGRLATDEAAAARFHILDLYAGFKEFNWALRMRFYHQMDAPETRYFIPFTSECFTRDHFNAVMEGSTVAESIAALPAGRLHQLLFHKGRRTSSRGVETLEELDVLGNRRLYREITRKQVTVPFTLNSFISFVMAQKYILEDIISVIQSKRFAMPPGVLETTLVTEGAVTR